MDATAPNPLLPLGFHDAFFEQRAGEEERGEEKHLYHVQQGDRIPAQETENLKYRSVSVSEEDVDGRGRGEGDGHRHEADTGANHRGGIAGEGGRRASGGRQVQWEDIEEGKGDLKRDMSISAQRSCRIHTSGWSMARVVHAGPSYDSRDHRGRGSRTERTAAVVAESTGKFSLSGSIEVGSAAG